MKRKLTYFLCVFLISVFLFDGLLRYVDPWGVMAYTNDSAQWIAHVTPDPLRDYHLASGNYRLSNWTMTILPDGTRDVPDTALMSSCTIVLVGDSQTFALGVSDAASWPNLVAKYYPKVRIINAGLPGTNADDALLNIRAFKANGYLYMLSENDADAPPPLGSWRMGQDRPALALYWFYAHPTVYGAGAISDTLWLTLNQIVAIPNVQIVAYKGGRMVTEAAKRYDVALVDVYTHTISRIDHHADVQGNVETAEVVLPVFDTLVTRFCDTTNIY